MTNQRIFEVRSMDDFNKMKKYVWKTGKLSTVRESQTHEVFDIMVDVSPKADLSKDLDIEFAKMRLEHIRHKVEFEMNDIIKLLKDDLTTRRARILEADYHPYNIACILAVQFFVRDGAVNGELFLRSSDLDGVLPYDIYATLNLQKTIQDTLNLTPRLLPLRLGKLTVHISCAHLYVNEKNVEAFVV